MHSDVRLPLVSGFMAGFGFLLLVPLFVAANDSGTSGFFLLFDLLGLSITQGADSVGRAGQLVKAVRDLTSSDQRDDNAGSNDKG